MYTLSIMPKQSKNDRKSTKSPDKLAREYTRLQQQLAELGYISQGTVNIRRETRTRDGKTIVLGPYYTWTRKQNYKTVTVSLSKEQYRWLDKAIKNQRKMDQILHRMQEISQQIVFETLPGVRKRNRLRDNDQQLSKRHSSQTHENYDGDHDDD